MRSSEGMAKISSFFRRFKFAPLFLLMVYALGAILAPSVYADETISFRWDTSYLSGNISGANGTYSLDSDDIVNYNNNYNILFPSYSSTPVSFQYISIRTSPVVSASYQTSRIDSQLRIVFDTDADFSKVVSGGSFILGLWIQNYRESYDFSVDSLYFESASGQQGSPLYNAQYIGYSSIGAVASRFYIEPNGDFLPLSFYTNMVVNVHWTGTPASGEVNFLLANSSYLQITDLDDGNIEYMQLQNQLARDVMEQAVQDLHVDSIDPSEVGSSIVDDLSVVDDMGVLDQITVDSSSAFVRNLIGWGATSLSVCLIGYILFGKKG